MEEYRSLYPNHFQQLTVSVSKHFYATKDGRIKYQAKPMEVNLNDVESSPRTHLVHYVIRDHCTGIFYAEIAFSDKLVSLTDFLNRAWSEKEDFVFCGLPELMTIPKTVENKFPKAKAAIEKIGVKFIGVTSGFQGGIRDVKSIENWLGVCCDKPASIANAEALRISKIMATEKSRNGVDDKVTLWKNHVKNIVIPPAAWAEES